MARLSLFLFLFLFPTYAIGKTVFLMSFLFISFSISIIPFSTALAGMGREPLRALLVPFHARAWNEPIPSPFLRARELSPGA